MISSQRKIDSIEEALCWMLPNGDDDAQCINIIDSKAEAIGERPPDHGRRVPLQISAAPAPIGS
jgi:hypothetical protein